MVTGAPIVDIVGSVGPAGISRPKHKRTYTGFGAGEVKSVEGKSLACFYPYPSLHIQTYIRAPPPV